MSLLTALRLNMTDVADPSARHATRYRAALEMAEYADRHGFTAVSAEEHHLAATGRLPSPLILAAALAGRTRNVRISQIRGGRKEILMNPLVGGLPIEAGWASLHLLTDGVPPRVRISARRSDRAAWSASPRCPRRWSYGRR